MTQDCSHSPFTATVGNPFTKGVTSSGLKNVSAQKVEGTPFPKQHLLSETLKLLRHRVMIYK